MRCSNKIVQMLKILHSEWKHGPAVHSRAEKAALLLQPWLHSQIPDGLKWKIKKNVHDRWLVQLEIFRYFHVVCIWLVPDWITLLCMRFLLLFNSQICLKLTLCQTHNQLLYQFNNKCTSSSASNVLVFPSIHPFSTTYPWLIQHCSLAPPGGSQGIPRPEEICSPSSGTSTGRRPGDILTRCPNHLSWHLQAPTHSPEETHFSHLYPQSHSCSHYPKLVITARHGGGDKGQPWQSSTPIENESDFLPRMQHNSYCGCKRTK